MMCCMKINSHIFTNIIAVLGFITFPIWLFFVFRYLPESAHYDFVEHEEEFTSIMAFVVVCMFFGIHLLTSMFLSIFAIENKKFKVESKNIFLKALLVSGLVLNFLPLVSFTVYSAYLLFFFE